MKKIIVSSVVLLVLSSFISLTIGDELSSNTDGLADSPWPMKCHDTRHTGRSPYSTADNNGEELWRFKTDNWIESGIVIDDKGTIYFGSFDYYFYALNPNGSLKWKYKTNGCVWSTPAIAEDGTIYVGTYGDYLYALNPNGTLKWRFYSNASISSSPAIASDGTIYFGTMGNPQPSERGCRVYAVNPDGTEKWQYQTDYKIVSDPAIGNDGTIYIGSGDNYLYALDPDGTFRWRFKTGDYVKSHPSIADDGTIYFDSFDGYLYALNPNGTEKWRVDGGGSYVASASIGLDGTIYDPGNQKLNAWYPNGTLKWSFDLGTPDTHIGHSSPAIGSDGTIFIGTSIGETSGGDIIAINPDGTEKWRSRIANRWVESSPCIGKDGTVYIASCSHDGGDEYGHLHAFGSGELKAFSNGPYKGMVNESVQFNGEASGGESPYSWYWDFGDGNTSTMQNPTHIYKTDGEYEATLTVTDNQSTSVSDGAFVKIYPYDVTPPTIELLRPLKGYIYIWNRITFRIFLATLIFGEIDVKAPADDDITGVSRVEFYLDGNFVHAISSTPYHWLWNEPGSGKHNVKVTAFDQLENNASIEIDVWKFL